MERGHTDSGSSDVTGGAVRTLEVLVVFSRQDDTDMMRSLHVYAQGPSLFSVQQDLLMSSTCYRVTGPPTKLMLPNAAAMTAFVEGQKQLHPSMNWMCILDFAVYSPLPRTMCALLAPTRNPFLSYLPSLLPDLQFVEAVITQKGCPRPRTEPALMVPMQSHQSLASPFIGSRVNKNFPVPLPSPRLWNDGESFTDLLSSAESSIPRSPLGSMHPNFASPTTRPETIFWADTSSPANGQNTQPGDIPRGPSPNSPLFPPPGGFGAPPIADTYVDCNTYTNPNFVPFVPGFLPDRAWGPWGTSSSLFPSTGPSDLYQQLNFLAEYPASSGPGVNSGSLYEDFEGPKLDQEMVTDQEKEGRLYHPPPRFKVPSVTVPGQDEESSSLLQESARNLPPRSRSNQPAKRFRVPETPTFQRASSAPAASRDAATEQLEEPAILSPLRGGPSPPEGVPAASLWVCIDAEASEGVRAGVSFLPPSPQIARARSARGPAPIAEVLGFPPPPPRLARTRSAPSDTGPAVSGDTCITGSFGTTTDQEVPSEASSGFSSPSTVQSLSSVGLEPGSPLSEDSPRKSDEFGPSCSIASPDFERSPKLDKSPGQADPGALSPVVNSPVSLHQSSVRKVVISRDPRRANARMSRLTLEEMQSYYDVPIAEAGKMLGVGTTVLKKRCRELGIQRWPHRKLKSIQGLITTITHLGDPEDHHSATAASLTGAVQRLNIERNQIAGSPSTLLAGETVKLRQACFKANFKIRKLGAGERVRSQSRGRVCRAVSSDDGSTVSMGPAGDESMVTMGLEDCKPCGRPMEGPGGLDS